MSDEIPMYPDEVTETTEAKRVLQIAAERDFYVGFMKWLLAPGFPIRWAASDNMAHWVMNNWKAVAAELEACEGHYGNAARKARHRLEPKAE